MKTSFLTFVPVAGLALLLAACSSGISARIQEKSEVFAQFTPEVQKNIREGTIEPGYTADMVYMALGKPTKETVKDTPHGKVGIWSYANFYPQGYETTPPASKQATQAEEKNDTSTSAASSTKTKTGEFKDNETSSGTIKRAPASSAVANDPDDAGVPATSSFVNVGSSDYGSAKSDKLRPSYTATDRRGFKPFVANSASFSDRSGAMEALDVPEMDSASLYVVFMHGRVVQMKLGRN